MLTNAQARAKYVKTAGQLRAPRRPVSRAAARSRISSLRGDIRVGNRMLRAMVQKESGYVDLAAASYACDTTGTITLLATVPQGAAVTQRVGKKIALKSIQSRGFLRSGTTTISCDTAVLMVYDKRPTGSLPAITDILVSANPQAFNNDANSGRFRILRRWDIDLVGNIGTAGQQTDKSLYGFDEYVDLKALPCVYKAAGTGAIADIEEGALYLVTVGSEAPGTTAGVLSAGFRVRFVDV